MLGDYLLAPSFFFRYLSVGLWDTMEMNGVCFPLVPSFFSLFGWLVGGCEVLVR